MQEIWTKIGGKEVAKIPVTTTPFKVRVLSTLETYCYAGDSTGNRIRGYIIAPETGAYTFYISSDDNGEFWLSTTDLPINKVKVANMPYWAGSRIWFNEPQQKSKAISLVKDQRYYFEALMKNGDGGDNLAVGWIKPNSTTIEIIGTPYIDTYTDDFEAPMKIDGLAASEITQTSFVLSWNRSSDNVGIEKYDVYKAFKLYGSTVDTFMIVTELKVGTTNSMAVKAKDAAAYTSNMSEVLKVKTLLTGISPIKSSKISIFPNPAQNILTIANIEPNSVIRITNIDGKILHELKNNSSTTQLNVSEWQSGLYFVSVSSAQEFSVKKVIIE
jgi:hypothetical protein